MAEKAQSAEIICEDFNFLHRGRYCKRSPLTNESKRGPRNGVEVTIVSADDSMFSRISYFQLEQLHRVSSLSFVCPEKRTIRAAVYTVEVVQ